MNKTQKKFLKENQIIIFSASSGGLDVYADLKRLKIKPVAFCDNSKEKHGTTFNGIPVISVEKLIETYKKDGAVVIIGSRSYYAVIYNQLRDLGIADEHILSYSLTKELTPIIYTDEQLNGLKKIMLDILIITHDICEKHNIDYYLHFGTLLGAVRHKGYIPWDDDIDIYMFRKDCERFFEICETELPEGYAISRDYEQESGLDTIYKTGTTKLPVWYSHDCEFKSFGINIDIFPLDNVKVKNGFVQKLQDAADIAFLAAYRRKFKSGYPKYKYYSISACLSLLPAKTILKLRKKITTINNRHKSNYVFYFFGVPNLIAPRTYKREYFNEKILLEFEGYKFWAPKEYDKLLSQTYGDNYMELPPENERSCHSTLKLEF